MRIEDFEEVEAALRFIGIDAGPDDCDICEDGSVWCGLTEVLPRGSVYDDEDGYDDEPSEGDFTITPCGSLGGKSGLGRVDGNFVGEFDCDDDAIAAARDIMEDESYWPNIWIVSDHGNWSLLSQ
jgi:hypothetical protein